MFEVQTRSAEETRGWGQKLGKLLSRGDVVCLSGDMGSGKTVFAQGLAAGLGVSERVTSPTFLLVAEYEGRIPFYHIDAYRLEKTSEVEELGLEEYMEARGVVAIEWPEKVAAVMNFTCLQVEIFVEEDACTRKLVFSPYSKQYEEVIEELKRVADFGA